MEKSPLKAEVVDNNNGTPRRSSPGCDKNGDGERSPDETIYHHKVSKMVRMEKLAQPVLLMPRCNQA